MCIPANPRPAHANELPTQLSQAIQSQPASPIAPRSCSSERFPPSSLLFLFSVVSFNLHDNPRISPQCLPARPAIPLVHRPVRSFTHVPPSSLLRIILNLRRFCGGALHLSASTCGLGSFQYYICHIAEIDFTKQASSTRSTIVIAFITNYF